MQKNELRERAYESARRIMLSSKQKSRLDSAIADAVAMLIVPMWMKSDAVSPGNGRISVARDARADATRMARCIGRMLNAKYHHGQQATECAQKTIRALRSGSITLPELQKRCVEFGRFRKKHIDRLASKKALLPQNTVRLPDSTFIARRLTSMDEVSHVGHVMGNCLNGPLGADYRSRMKNGELELVVLEEDGQGPVVLMSVDTDLNTADEAKGIGNQRPIRYREQIIEALIARKFETMGNDLWNLAICDELLIGRSSGSTRLFNFDGWKCECANGAVVTVKDENTVLLRCCGDELDLRCSGPDTGESERADEARVRRWFRQTCRRHAAFRVACLEALDSVCADVLQDWFDE